ncbi:hypothetical protein PG985_002819 [Apiospora marii]|uniref:uncharacterized protein n=1 Tax=Apiospora marii TaxID=335849 RepID=UPI003130C4F4
MARMVGLPVELLEGILDNIDDPNDLTSLARVNHTFHTLADKRIWKGADRRYRYLILMWACATGNAPALHRLLNLEFTTNLHFQVGAGWPRDEFTSDFYLRLRDRLYDSWSSDPLYVAIPYHDDFYEEPDAPAIDQSHRGFWKPLHAAVYHSQGHIVDILLHHGAWVDEIARDYHGCDRPPHYFYDPTNEDGRYTPLHVALCSGQEKIAMKLISNGASIYTDRTVHRHARARDPKRNRLTALHLCAYHGLLETAEYLVENGYQTAIDELDEFGYSPITYAYVGRHDSIFFYLLSQGASTRFHEWDILPQSYRSFLHQACRDRRWETVDKLAEYGCDASEPDDYGYTPLELCMNYCNTFTYPDTYKMSVSERNLDAQKMFKAIESCGMHGPIKQDILLKAGRYALRESVPSLVTFVLDHGLDISTLLYSHNVYDEDGREGSPLYKRDWPQDVEPQNYYHDTGLFPCEQTLLEFASCCIRPSPYLEEVIDLLLARGGINPGDIESYVRVLKNLCCSRYGSWGDDPNEFPRLQCVRKICSHLAATRVWQNSRPELPVSLFFICLDRCQRVFLDELLNVFDFPDWECSDDELRGFLLLLTRNIDYSILYGPEPDIIIATLTRRFSYLEFLFKAGKHNYFLQHEETFVLLYTTLLQVEGERRQFWTISIEAVDTALMTTGTTRPSSKLVPRTVCSSQRGL